MCHCKQDMVNHICSLFHFTVPGEREQGESPGDEGEREQTSETTEETEREQHTGHQAKAAGFQDVCFDLGDKDTGPKQLNLSQYPQDQFGTQKRAFQQNWLQSFKWLEYSSRKKCCCLLCLPGIW